MFRKVSGVAWGSIRTAFEGAVRAAKRHGVVFQTLRDTFASHAMMRGVTLSELRNLLGHSDIRRR